MPGHKFVVSGLEPRRVRQLAVDVGTDDGFAVEEPDRWEIRLRQGGMASSILLGAFIAYCDFPVSIQDFDDDSVEVVLQRNNPWWTGLIGVNRVKKRAKGYIDALKDALEDAGGRIEKEREF